jgi:hypothetical protein
MVQTRRHKIVLAAAALCVLGAGAVRADQPVDRGSTPGLGWGAGGSHGAPGPVAGAGLPFIILVGAYGAYRRYARRRVERSQVEQSRQS